MIFHTADGGKSWTPQVKDTAYVRAITFVDSRLGFAGTLSSKYFLRTTDGGRHWKNIAKKIPKHGGICGIAHVGKSEIYAVGRYTGSANFYRSSDSGETWKTQDLSSLADALVDVSFISPKTGFIAGSHAKNGGTILATDDGGAHWRVAYSTDIPNEYVWKLNFVTPSLGYASVESFDQPTYILKTTDSGRHWKKLPVTDEGIDAEGIGFIDENTGWVGGYSSGIWETRNGGLNWNYLSYEETGMANVNRFVFPDNKTAFAAGSTVYALGKEADPARIRNPDALRIHTLESLPVSGGVRLILKLKVDTEVVAEVFDETRRTLVKTFGARSLTKGTYDFKLTSAELGHGKFFVLFRMHEHFLWANPTL